jgi:signal transduction histidine kinase
VVEEVRNAHPDRQIDLTVEGTADAHCDPDRIAQVVTNLLVNAVVYSPGDTSIRVEVAGNDEELVLAIHNRGEPIPAQKLSKIFEPMQRATSVVDRNRRSIGLGLYIVKHILQAHQGSVSVTSTAEDGTRFEVRLPRKLSLP